jgi:hypothetical protein
MKKMRREEIKIDIMLAKEGVAYSECICDESADTLTIKLVQTLDYIELCTNVPNTTEDF